ncbi:DUF4339 domain-containing protein [Salicibibacter cibi]|uniref:DUF4339 domain-containing protein n=1 Tax=Salicibibacter cibi TaxID=2743001 RepID=A0A7T6ZBG0_9BACI|nr:PrsW family glutamic-type intramembrane protease [Salicibibacter cibi]QQK80368.1 DUF4339 domain-containing protein [Salicibibacter cibi]
MSEDGEKIGPYTEDDMLHFYNDHIIRMDTYVWQEGLPEWNYFQESLYIDNTRQADYTAKSVFDQATTRVNQMVGEEGAMNVQLRDVFSEVFNKHSKEEAEKLFIAGTAATTPREEEISAMWPKPWLFSRVFFTLIVTYIILFYSASLFYNPILFSGLMIIGSFAVPFSLMIFFWEMNAPRNISLFEIVKMFFVGGVLSLFLTLILFNWFSIENLGFFEVFMVGIIEEVGKLVIIGYFIYKLNTHYVLNGLLIGATIGATFAAFETSGYAMNAFMMLGDGAMIDVLFNRAWSSIGAHTV